MPGVITTLWIPLKAGTDTTPPAAQAPPKGLVAGYKGKGLDAKEPLSIELIGHWDSVSAAQAFSASAEGQAGIAALDAVTDKSHPAAGKTGNIFALEGGDPAAILGAPVTQITAFVVPAADIAAFDAEWAKLGTPPQPADLVDTAFGWSAEEAEHDGGKGKVFVVANGWKSIEAANATKEQAEKASAGLIAISKPHVRFTTLTKQT